MRKILLYIIAILFAAEGAQGTVISENTVDSLWNVLAATHNPTDSLKIMYNIFDINTATMTFDAAKNKNSALLNQMYDVALRAGDTVTALDVVRNIVTVDRYDLPNIDYELKRIENFGPSIEKTETETYLRLQRHIWMARDTAMTEAQRRKNFHSIREQLESQHSSSKSLYDRLTTELALVLYGGSLIQSEMMDKYLRDLTRLVDRTRSQRFPIKSLYYTIAPVLYDDNEDWAKAVVMDRKMLDVLNQLKAQNEQSGRIYKKYDRFEFVANRRLLSHFDYLEPGEPEIVYSRLKKLMNELPPDHLTHIDKLAVKAMWEMYRKDYKNALEDLRTVLSSNSFSQKPIYLLSYIKAAAAENSLEDLEKGQKKYIELLKKRAQDAADTEYARLRIAYEMDTLETSRNQAINLAEEARLEIDEANIKTRDLNKDIWIFGTIALAVFLLIIILTQRVANRRSHEMAEQLRHKNEDLMTERDSLRRTQSELMAARDRAAKAVRQKNDFIYNVSHEISEPVKAIVGFTQLVVDSIPEERRRYLAGFIDLINDNSRILQRLVGDIMDTAEAEDAVTNVNVSHFRLENLCERVAENFKPRLTKDQTIVVEPLQIVGESPDDDPAVDTDADRLEQILINVVNNAVKFCEHGTITITPSINYNKKELTVAVTDQGPGIPPEKADMIFERFEKLGQYSNGLGLGLYISRLLARLLEGDIVVDLNHRHGARFIITLPVSIRPSSVIV
ncbi:MAG: HAMP domain-containing histidine kinase [Muribaculaceae bacterium]|nr:HAMP domain-containing histidine kinase [Muribaculaceae bacterium]